MHYKWKIIDDLDNIYKFDDYFLEAELSTVKQGIIY
jgi:hypothetical protein